MTEWQVKDADSFVGADGSIDVRRLMASVDPEVHADRADRYYAAVPLHDPQFRKPVGDPGMARDMLRKMTLAMQLLDAQPGQRVMDYGCGTGWLSRALAQQGLEVVGVDVSATALAKSVAYTAVHMPQIATRIRHAQITGGKVPVEDQSVDRVVCYDVFHHVHDQATVLGEMFRVLSPGGRAVFIEPGPRHSRSPASQTEMRQHGVIENDVVLEEIWPLAQVAGFERCEVAVVPNLPLLLSLPEFTAEAARVEAKGQPSPATVERVFARLDPWIENMRCFVLHRGGKPAPAAKPAAAGAETAAKPPATAAKAPPAGGPAKPPAPTKPATPAKPAAATAATLPAGKTAAPPKAAAPEPGSTAPSSREIPRTAAQRPEPLAAVSATAAPLGEQIAVSVEVRNLGPFRWLPGGSGVGSVNLGVMRRVAGGGLERDFRRVRMASRPVEPGETIRLTFDLPVAGSTGWMLDLVAEEVTWFGLDVPLEVQAPPARRPG
ncbi:methyltransferase domain-containing protein [Roseomonas sp. BN140053]|uniref:methyltransferase domain-containing protein n=1 Tax=Roseomonas sp. BN140053 TaxID=3391898 RepID=UPI0039EB5E9B